jgi:hypothetical protein
VQNTKRLPPYSCKIRKYFLIYHILFGTKIQESRRFSWGKGLLRDKLFPLKVFPLFPTQNGLLQNGPKKVEAVIPKGVGCFGFLL